MKGPQQWGIAWRSAAAVSERDPGVPVNDGDPGIFEDHGDGNNLGSSLMNIGETLMAIEISDNMRVLICLVHYLMLIRKILAQLEPAEAEANNVADRTDERIKRPCL